MDQIAENKTLNEICADKSCFAGFPRRFFALIIDIIVIHAFFTLLSVIIFIIDSSLLSGVTVLLILDIVVSIIYYAAFESSAYQASIGKMFMSIKVVNASGEKISFSSALIRSIVKNISGIFPVLYIVCLFTKKKQNLHDFAGRTFVVHKNSFAVPSQKSEKSMKIAMIITILFCALFVALLAAGSVFLIKEGINMEVLTAESAIKNAETPDSLVWPEKRFESIGVSVSMPLTLTRNAEKESLSVNDKADGITAIECYGFYNTSPFMFDIRHITYNAPVNLRDIMLKQGLRGMTTNDPQDIKEFTLEDITVSGREAVKAVRNKVVKAESMDSKLGSGLVAAAEALNKTEYGKFDQIIVIRDTPQKAWIAHGRTSEKNRYPYVEKMMNSLKIEK